MATTNIEQLEREIERLVSEHVAACRRAAAAAVDRAFANPGSRRNKPQAGRVARRTTGRRRTPEQIAELGDRLCEAVRARPGETMAVLAPHVGATVAELNRPMTVLKRAGRIRSVGQRHNTRYFPLSPR